MAPGDAPMMGAAINEAVFGDYSKCSSACGTCYELTSLGNAPPGLGPSGQPTNTITVMIVDACPVKGNEKFCSAPNEYGKSVHFDLAVPENADHGPNHWGESSSGSELSLDVHADLMTDNVFVKYRKLDKCPTTSITQSRSMTQKRQAGAWADNFKNCRCGK